MTVMPPEETPKRARVEANLSPDAIAEALVELRFRHNDSADLVPARLIDVDWLPKSTIVRLPQAEIPQPIRRADENLRYAPLLQRRSNDGRALLNAGEQIVSWHATAPYPGWALFKPDVERVVDRLFAKVGSVSVERIGLRYVNVLTADVHQVSELDALNIGINIGSLAVTNDFNLNYKRSKEECDAIVKIATQAFVDRAPTPFSFLIDVDVFTPPNHLIADKNQVLAWIEKAHVFLKELFFELLAQSTFDRLTGGKDAGRTRH